jgi:outer membrane protein assembly factor BamB
MLATVHGSDWPQWLGPTRNGHAPANGPLTSLPTDPKANWRKNIGGGFSSPVVAGGKLLYLDAQDGKEVAHLVDAATGSEIWQVPFADMFQDEWGPGPRSTPILDGDRAYVQSCNGEFRCLSLADGKLVWGTSFARDYGVTFLGSKAKEGTARRRGNNGSGLIDGDRLVLPVGSTNGASLVCFNKYSGQVLWRSGEDEAAYASLGITTLRGVRQVLNFNADALTGTDLSNGTLLWRVPLKTNAKRHAASPLVFGDDVIVNSHTLGLVCHRIAKQEEGYRVTTGWVNKDLRINLATPVLVDHYLYGHGQSKNFFCVDARDGKLLWSQNGFGKEYSSTLAVGDKLLVLTDLGELILIAADPTKYTELGRVQICGKTWSFPAYSGGRLYVREGLTDGFRLSCFQLQP